MHAVFAVDRKRDSMTADGWDWVVGLVSGWKTYAFKVRVRGRDIDGSKCSTYR